MSDYPMLISNKLHSFRNFLRQNYNKVVVLQRHYWHLKEYNYFCSRVLKQWKHKAN